MKHYRSTNWMVVCMMDHCKVDVVRTDKVRLINKKIVMDAVMYITCLKK